MVSLLSALDLITKYFYNFLQLYKYFTLLWLVAYMDFRGRNSNLWTLAVDLAVVFIDVLLTALLLKAKTVHPINWPTLQLGSIGTVLIIHNDFFPQQNFEHVQKYDRAFQADPSVAAAAAAKDMGSKVVKRYLSGYTITVGIQHKW